jgi:hypothetical protein
MDSNMHSTGTPGGLTGLAALAAAFDRVNAQDLDRLDDAARVDRARKLRGLLDRLEAIWLQELAVVDARGLAGAEQGVRAPSTAEWLSARLGVSADTANSWVRAARALPRRP